MDETQRAISRREALQLSAKVAGTAAFAAPIVVGAFSVPALAQTPTCDPATDSDAAFIQSAVNREYNVNCGGVAAPYGRYNSQRSTFAAPELGPGKQVFIRFGFEGVDNFRVECSFYTIEAPVGCVCTAAWAMEKPKGTTGCASGYSQFMSTPVPTCEPDKPAPPANALALPYCKPTDGRDDCPGGQFLVLKALVCCCTD